MIAALLLPLLATPAPSLAAPLAPATPVAAPVAPQGPDEDEVPAIQEQGDLYIINFAEAKAGQPQEQGMSLEEFVKICQQATGQNFTYNNETANLLKSQHVRLFGTKRIPKTDFYRFFQIMMFINDFACIEIGPEHLKVIVIQSLQQAQQRSTIKQRSVYVVPDELPAYEDQPAVLITTRDHPPRTRTSASSRRRSGR